MSKSVSFRNAAIGVAVLAGGVGIYQLVSSYAKKNDPDSDEARAADVKSITYDPKNTTRPSYDYIQAANSIYDHFDKSRIPATNIVRYKIDFLVNLLTPYNGDELKRIAKEFGVRQWSFFGLFKAGDAGGLIDFFDAVLSPSDLSTIKAIFRRAKDWTWGFSDPAIARQEAVNKYYDQKLCPSSGKCVTVPELQKQLKASGNAVWMIDDRNSPLNSFYHSAWNSFASIQQKKGTSPDFYIVPLDYSKPFGIVTGYTPTSGNVFALKVKLHPGNTYRSSVNPNKILKSSDIGEFIVLATAMFARFEQRLSGLHGAMPLPIYQRPIARMI